MRCAAFNTGSEFHLLDHIAPLAELMQMPLFVTEEQNYDLARHYYPQVEVRLIPDLEFQLGAIAEQFDALFECKFWGTHLKSLFQQLYKKEMRLIFCPHGHSDKGAHVLGQFPLQDIVLLYGDLQIEMLQSLRLWPLSNYALIGNYRLPFYLKYQSHFDSLAEKEIFSHLNPKNRTLLYAPTWKDAAASSSFFQHGRAILSQLPSDWNLLIKVHPLLEQRDPSHFYSIASLIDQKPNALLIHEFPPVYPLLTRSDAYLGDLSSIGYDFLTTQRPLFFLPTAAPAKLQSCGRIIDPSIPIYPQLDTHNSYKEQQKTLSTLAFKESVNARQNILKILR